MVQVLLEKGQGCRVREEYKQALELFSMLLWLSRGFHQKLYPLIEAQLL